LWPLTGQLAFIDAASSDVVEVLATWRELGREPAVSAVTGSLRDLRGGLQPLGFGYRELVLPTTSRWTSYWSNHFNGRIPRRSAISRSAWRAARYGDAGWLVTTRDPRPDVRATVAELQKRYGYTPGAD
jgi:hypothetical protein